MSNKTSTSATLAGGCFWCLEAAFEVVHGVTKVVSGYCGGHVPHPSYEQISTGTTGHAESVQLTFAPTDVSYHELLRIFFSIHDPTTQDRQGPDVGHQYRSVIFYHDEYQKVIAEQVTRDLQEAPDLRPIVTEIVPIQEFYEAETYHQQYYRRNTTYQYCQIVIAPKVDKLRKDHLTKLKQDQHKE